MRFGLNMNRLTQKQNGSFCAPQIRSLLTAQGFMMHLTVDVGDVTALRRQVIGHCGELVAFMRIQPLQHASKMRVWISLKEQEFDFVKRAIRSGLPAAEFGCFTEV